MQNNNWLKIALFSFIGLIVLSSILSLITPGGYFEGNNGSSSNKNEHADMLSQQPQTGSGTGMGGSMTGVASSANLQTQGGMGMTNISAPANNSQMNSNQIIIQRMDNMQVQMQQMMYQLNMINQRMNNMGVW